MTAPSKLAVKMSYPNLMSEKSSVFKQKLVVLQMIWLKILQCLTKVASHYDGA